MTKDGAITEESVIGRFQKSMNASVQVSLVNWQGADFVDIREVIPGDQGFTFTKKGVRFKADLVGELRKLLEQVSM